MRATQRVLQRGALSAAAPHGLRRGGQRSFCADNSGAQTLGAVVRELRKEGRLPVSDGGFQPQAETPSWVTKGFIDIDSELAAGADESEIVEGGAGAGAELEDADDATLADLEEFGGGTTAEGEDRELRGSVRAGAIEDVSHLSEEELRERVRRSIEELIPQDTADAISTGSSVVQDTSSLTPAQVFYLENRDRLVSRAQQYYLDKQRELQAQQEEGLPAEVEDEWRYHHEPVVRPPKGHLWSTGEEGMGGEDHGMEQGWLDTVEDWPQGQMPTAEMLADLLRAEQAKDVYVVDLDACGRRDVGTFGITASGVTSQHCRRLGEIMSRAVQHCRVPHVEAFCYGTRRDEWVVAHCGPIKVHLFTREMRELYKLELLWENPNEFFIPGDFPHFVEVYGTAVEAHMAPGAGHHVTQPGGSRSTSYLPPPFQDTLHARIAMPDYDAAEDTEYVSPSQITDVGVQHQRPLGTGPIGGWKEHAEDGLPPLRAPAARRSDRRSSDDDRRGTPSEDEADTEDEEEEGEAPAQGGRRSRRAVRQERAPLDKL